MDHSTEPGDIEAVLISGLFPKSSREDIRPATQNICEKPIMVAEIRRTTVDHGTGLDSIPDYAQRFRFRHACRFRQGRVTVEVSDDLLEIGS